MIVKFILFIHLFQAFDKVKNQYPVSGGHLALITEDRYTEIKDILANHFMPDETICGAFNVVWNPFSERKLCSLLKENLSIMAVSDDTNEIMGVRTCRVAKATDKSDFSDVTYENVKALWTFLTHKDTEIDIYNHYHVSEMFHFVNLAVHKKFRRRGLGSILLGAGVALAKELGFKAIKGEGTSDISQRIYEKHNFTTVYEMRYDQYKYKDSYLNEKTGANTSTKIYVLQLNP